MFGNIYIVCNIVNLQSKLAILHPVYGFNNQSDFVFESDPSVIVWFKMKVLNRIVVSLLMK